MTTAIHRCRLWPRGGGPRRDGRERRKILPFLNLCLFAFADGEDETKKNKKNVQISKERKRKSSAKQLLVRRDDPIPAADDPTYPLGTPIVVCTRNDALDSVFDKTPAERRKDLVFIQNGMIQPWLARKEIDTGSDAATQVLVFFAVSAKGEAPVDGVTDTDPQGLTAAHGRHAAAFASRLRRSGGLSCRVIESRAEFDAAALEKLVWISAFMLIGAKYGGLTVGEVESEHTEEVSELIRELAAGGATARALGPENALPGNLVEKLRAYARSVAHFPTAVKEFEWRNGWFWELSKVKKESGGGEQDPFPTHSRLLKEVGAV